MKKDNFIILVAFILCCIFLLVYFGAKYNREHKPARTIAKTIQTKPENKAQLSAYQIKKVQDLIDTQNRLLEKIKKEEDDIIRYKTFFKEHNITGSYKTFVEKYNIPTPYKDEETDETPLNLPNVKIEELNTSNYEQALTSLVDARPSLDQKLWKLQDISAVYSIEFQKEIMKNKKPIPYEDGPFGINQNYVPFIKNLINLAKEKEISNFTDEEIYEAAKPYQVLSIYKSLYPYVIHITLQDGRKIGLEQNEVEVPSDKGSCIIIFSFNGDASCLAPIAEGYQTCQDLGGTDPVKDKYTPSIMTYKLQKNIFNNL